MADIKKIISEAVTSGKRNYVVEAVQQLLGEDISVGQKVAIIDDVMYGYSGGRGVVKSISDSNPGYAEVALENGKSMFMQSSLLVPV